MEPNTVFGWVASVLAPHAAQRQIAFTTLGKATELWPVVTELEAALRGAGWHLENPGMPHYPCYGKDGRFIDVYIGWAGAALDDNDYRLSVMVR